jgi:peroxiredoxin
MASARPTRDRPKNAGPNRPRQRGPAPRKPTPARPGRRRWVSTAIVVAILLALGGLYLTFRSNTTSTSGASSGGKTYQVGTPGIGAPAILFTLPSASGKPVSLSDYHGKTVLLYFHEGLGCQPCWDQIRDLQKNTAALRAAGVDNVVSITSGPRDLIAQKMNDDKLTATSLADTDLSVSKRYNANKYGMMGTDRDGHTFILVGPDGRIQWRADYGGAPRYTMYVAVNRLLNDLKAGRSTE